MEERKNKVFGLLGKTLRILFRVGILQKNL